MALSSVRVRSPDDPTNVTLPFFHSPIDIRPLACDDRYDKAQWMVRLSLGFNAYVADDLGRFLRSESNGGDSQQLAEDVWVLAKEVRKQIEERTKYTERMPVWVDDYLVTIAEGMIGLLGDEAVYVFIASYLLSVPQHKSDVSYSIRTPSRWYPILSSIGVMDKYLARSHPLATGGQLTVGSPRLSPTFCSTFMGGCLALHAFTWGGELMLAFSFPEGVMGSAQDQVIALNEGRDGDAIGLQFINEFMDILDVISQSK
ncbi:hypothetical protein PHLCEN_2v9456 [Hermanssonia centrifuga]|uniref:Uncharacterized protein n=1 Tax=Hermanssonia centrifuga TaxID=98765 RepID=A0A2R6NQP6_9APHY|nr:hypothetical protein PHLCEN_2v9456 [Hermanssonia centrifuga]